MPRGGFFAGIEDASVTAGGVYFLANKGPEHTDENPKWEPALYVVEVLRLITMVSRKKEDLFILEGKIIESDNPERKAGMTSSWVVNLKQDAALGNIKGCIAALNGIEPSDKDTVDANVTEEVCELAVDDSQPLAGTLVGLQCTMIKTKKNTDFTLHTWMPLVEAE